MCAVLPTRVSARYARCKSVLRLAREKWLWPFYENWFFYRAIPPDTICYTLGHCFHVAGHRVHDAQGRLNILQAWRGHTCMQEKKPMVHTSPSVCPLDCADTCSLTVT